MSKFKVGDLVYYPDQNEKIFKLEESNLPIYRLQITTDDFDYKFTDDGFLISYYPIPVIFHATPENHAELERLYGIEFEKPPAPTASPTSREIIQVMLDRLIRLRVQTCVVRRYLDKVSFDCLWQQKYQFPWYGLTRFLMQELKDIKIIGVKTNCE